MTRLEAAAVISEAVEAGGYTTSVWAPANNNGPVRVYVTIPAANWKKKAQKIGHISVSESGAVESELAKQSGAIMALIPSLEISPVSAKQAGQPAAAAFTGDSSLDSFEAERIAEQGRTGELPGA